MASSQKSQSKPQPVPLLTMRTLALLLSSVFFAICAYVNLNDPDPSYWITLYLSGSIICFLSIGELIPKFLADTLALYSLYAIYVHYQEMVNSAAYKDVFHSHLNSWEFFETEQGREIGGLVYLIFGVILSRYPSNSNSAFLKSMYFVCTGAMLGGIYATWYVQPSMNQTNFVEHCSGSL